MINEALAAIVNLLKLKKDAKKTDLEIEKLERERKKEKSTLNIASFDDIKKYDPRTRDVFENAERIRRDEDIRLSRRPMDVPPLRTARPGGLWWLIVVLVVAYLAYKYAT